MSYWDGRGNLRTDDGETVFSDDSYQEGRKNRKGVGYNMAEKFKGTHIDGETIKAMVPTLTEEELIEAFISVRDMAYSIGYRHGHEDKVKDSQ